MNNNNKSENRFNTDSSLQYERNKTDKTLEEEIKILEDKSDITISYNRKKADIYKKSQRKSKNMNNCSTDIYSQINRERQIFDRELEKSRKAIDIVIVNERRKKKEISEALLINERKDTDNILSTERSGNDVESNGKNILLSNAVDSLVSRDEYLAIVSHDLKNPLGSIRLCTGMLKKYVGNKDINEIKMMKTLDTIERNVITMDKMISDLLDVERMSNGSLFVNSTKSNIKKLLEECQNIFKPLTESRDITLTFHSSEDFQCEMDYDRILQVMSNLIGNALKFTKNGGKIEIFAECINNEVKISIIDNGTGIDKCKQNQIFQKFSQLKSNDRRGIGLGLFISKMIIEAHHGQLNVISDLGLGSNFYFTIPNKFIRS